MINLQLGIYGDLIVSTYADRPICFGYSYNRGGPLSLGYLCYNAQLFQPVQVFLNGSLDGICPRPKNLGLAFSFNINFTV